MAPKKKCKVSFTDQTIQTIAKKLNHDEWKPLGRFLVLDENVLNDIEGRYSSDFREMRTQMLFRWQKTYGLEATQSKLIEGLRNIERKDIADEIEEQNQQLKNEEKIGEMFESIVKKLLNYYKNLPLPRAPWLHKKEMTINDLYTDLTLIEKDKNEEVKLANIFESSNDSKRVLIEGDPGCGKTTFLFKLAHDWANGENYIGSKFTLVILIALKDFENTVESTICQQVPGEICSAEYMKEIIKLKEENTLLLLDGLDEIQQDSKLKLIPILKNEVFGSATVFVTCRKGEANFMIEKETIPRKGLFRLGVEQTDSHFWDKKFQVKGFSCDKRQQFLEKYFADDHEKLEVANSFCKSARMINNLAEVPLFLIILTVVIENCNAQIKMTMTDLYKSLFKLIIKNNLQEEDEVDIFNDYQDKPSFSTSLLLKFGQLALKSLISGRQYFTKEETDICEDDMEDDVKRLGLLTQNVEVKNHEKIETYHPFHVSFLEFAAAFRLSYICNRPENKEEFENVLIKIIRSKPNLMLHQFLLGLLGDKTYLYFNAVSSFAAFFPVTPSFMNSLLSEVQQTQQIVRSLLPFVPPVWEVDDDEFFRSNMHSSLLEMATVENRIQSFLWVLDNSVNIPEYFKCKYISLYVEDDTEFFQEYQDKMPKTQKIVCDALRCQLDFSHEFWDSMVEIINRIKWQKLNLMICGKDIGIIVEKLYNEFTKGSWKSRKHCSLSLVINETGDFNYLPNIKNLLDETLIHDLTIAVEESAENSSWRKKLSIQSLFGQFWQNRPIQSLINDIINTPALASFRLFGNNLNKPVNISESFLCKSDWKSIFFEGPVEWRNENIFNNGLFLDGFAMRKETDKNIEIDVNLLLAIKSPQAFALSSPHLHELMKKVPSNWQGFESITTMALTLPETFQPIHLEGLMKMKKLKSLSLDLTSVKLSNSVVDDLSKIFCEIPSLYFLDFNIRDENLSVYLKLLEKIAKQSANFENAENERRSNEQSENSHTITNDTVHSRCQVFHVENLSIYFDCDSDNAATKSNVANIFNIFEQLLRNDQIKTFHYYCSLKCLKEIPLYEVKEGSLDFKYTISFLPQEEDVIIELLGLNFVNEYISVSLKN